MCIRDSLKTQRAAADAENLAGEIQEAERDAAVIERANEAAVKRLRNAEEGNQALAELRRQKEMLDEALARGKKTEEKLQSKIQDVVSFALLGHRTQARSFLILADVSVRLKKPKDYSATLVSTIERVLESLNESHMLEILGYQVRGSRSNPRVEFHRWPSGGGPAKMTKETKREAAAFTRTLPAKAEGAAATFNALRTALDSPTEAILLMTYGVPRWPVDMDWRALVREITKSNAGAKEIHTIAMGIAFSKRNYYKDEKERTSFIAFMQTLAKENGGDFSAVVDD